MDKVELIDNEREREDFSQCLVFLSSLCWLIKRGNRRDADRWRKAIRGSLSVSVLLSYPPTGRQKKRQACF